MQSGMCSFTARAESAVIRVYDAGRQPDRDAPAGDPESKQGVRRSLGVQLSPRRQLEIADAGSLHVGFSAERVFLKITIEFVALRP